MDRQPNIVTMLADGLSWGGLTPEMADCRFPQLRRPMLPITCVETAPPA